MDYAGEQVSVSEWGWTEKVFTYRAYLGVLAVTKRNGDTERYEQYLQYVVELKPMLGFSSEDVMALSIEYSIELSLAVMTAFGEPEKLERLLTHLEYDVSKLKKEAPT
jgi:hypothetical protein